MKNKNGLIIGGGKVSKDLDIRSLSQERLVIAVDSGFDRFRNLNIHIDYLLGDFDSIKTPLGQIENTVIVDISEEDGYNYTDMELAINFSKDLGLEDVIIIGALGHRFDHSLINVILLKKFLDFKCQARIIDKFNLVQIIRGQAELERGPYKYVSFIPIYEDTCVSLEGFKYPLENKILQIGGSLSVSNEILRLYGLVKTNKDLIIIQSKES